MKTSNPGHNCADLFISNELQIIPPGVTNELTTSENTDYFGRPFLRPETTIFFTIV